LKIEEVHDLVAGYFEKHPTAVLGTTELAKAIYGPEVYHAGSRQLMRAAGSTPYAAKGKPKRHPLFKTLIVPWVWRKPG